MKEIEEEQDEYLDDIERSMSKLHDAGVAMNAELTSQNTLLDDTLLPEAEHTSSHLRRVTEHIDDYLLTSKTSECNSPPIACIILCLIILSILLLNALFLL